MYVATLPEHGLYSWDEGFWAGLQFLDDLVKEFGLKSLFDLLWKIQIKKNNTYPVTQCADVK